MKRRIEVDMVELASAFENADAALSYYLDLESGEVLLVTDGMRGAFERISDAAEREGVAFATALAESDLPAWMKDAMAEVAVVEEGYGRTVIAVPEADSREAFGDMEAFALLAPNARFGERLLDALSGSRPFRRFKEALADYPGEKDRWFAFRDGRVRQRVLHWLDDEGIELID